MGEFNLVAVGPYRLKAGEAFPPDFMIPGSPLDHVEFECVIAEWLIAASRHKRQDVAIEDLLEVCSDPRRIRSGNSTGPNLMVIQHYVDQLVSLGYLGMTVDNQTSVVSYQATEKLQEMLINYTPPQEASDGEM